MSPLIANGQVSWFNLGKKFGFVELEGGMRDAFLHVSVLKEAGYVSVPAGTTMQVRVESERGRQRIVEVLSVDTRTANASCVKAGRGINKAAAPGPVHTAARPDPRHGAEAPRFGLSYSSTSARQLLASDNGASTLQAAFLILGPRCVFGLS